MRERDEAQRMEWINLDLAERHMNEKHERGRQIKALEAQLTEARAEIERLTRERDAARDANFSFVRSVVLSRAKQEDKQ